MGQGHRRILWRVQNLSNHIDSPMHTNNTAAILRKIISGMKRVSNALLRTPNRVIVVKARIAPAKIHRVILCLAAILITASWVLSPRSATMSRANVLS